MYYSTIVLLELFVLSRAHGCTRRRGGLETFLEGSAWAEFEGFSNNLFLRAIEGMDMGDEAYELAYESGVLDS